MFKKFLVAVLLLSGIFGITRYAEKVVACSSQGECASLCNSCPNACTYDCEIVDPPSPNGTCYSTCEYNNGTTCSSWSAWGPCSGGWQERYCQAPASNNEMNVQACGGPSPTPGPTAPPSCTISAPGVTPLYTPANGSTTTVLDPTLTWGIPAWGNGCNNDNHFIVYVDTANPPVTQRGTYAETTTNYQFTAGAYNTRYYWRVLATNGAQFAYSETWSFVTPGLVAGTVYDDIDGNCAGSASGFAGSMSANYRSDVNSATYSSTVGVNGLFEIAGSPAGYGTLSLTNLPVGYTCSLCSSCTRGSVISPSYTNTFYLTANREAWWQVAGAGVYAGSTSGTSITSNLPTTTSRLVIPGAHDYGAIVHASSARPTLGFGTQVSDSQWEAQSTYRGKIMDYSYFAAKMGLTSSSQNYWGSNSLTVPTSSQDFYLSEPAGGEAVIAGDWTLTSTDSYVILVNGDLRIEGNITVPPGGFLAFIVNGTVTVDPDVITLQGLYVMDDVFNTESNGGTDLPLNVAGTVVTWGGVGLNRDLITGNYSTPAEKFSYRPDFLTNMPEKMKSFALNWQEVSPGTFGN